MTVSDPVKILRNNNVSSNSNNMLNNTRHVILTGGSSGIGYEAAKALAQDPSTVVVVASRVRLEFPCLGLTPDTSKGPPVQR
jgi:hypothetical protein